MSPRHRYAWSIPEFSCLCSALKGWQSYANIMGIFLRSGGENGAPMQDLFCKLGGSV